MTDLQTLSDRLDDAMKAFADENGDGFGNRDHLGARDYRDDGYEIAAGAVLLPTDEDRERYIDLCLEFKNDFGREVVAAAAWYRLAELSK